MIANARGDTDHAAAHGIESAVTDIGNARGHATDVETMIEVTGAGIGRGVANTTDEMIDQSGGESEMQVTCDRVHARGTADQDGEAGRHMSRLRRGGTEHGVFLQLERLPYHTDWTWALHGEHNIRSITTFEATKTFSLFDTGYIFSYFTIPAHYTCHVSCCSSISCNCTTPVSTPHGLSRGITSNSAI
jgi:hypothetical protein